MRYSQNQMKNIVSVVISEMCLLEDVAKYTKEEDTHDTIMRSIKRLENAIYSESEGENENT